ncbi:MAG TPA: NAD-dependent epimerase/dehydratase family protein [Trebonia sp.]|nr:NAD-dependent epimerase/dehydratase family protein [Trebonia sp.]
MAAARVLVTGSSGHLGEALVRVLRDGGYDVTGIDVTQSPYTTVTGSVTDRALVRECLAGAGAVLHAATLHKPHLLADVPLHRPRLRQRPCPRRARLVTPVRLPRRA